MIDWHSHILPAIDDGSKSCQESLSLINMLSSQGVDTIVATPHFYAESMSCEEFIEKRTASYNSLLDTLTSQAPKIELGAEIRYYRGISSLNQLESLRVAKSKCIMLEMPEFKWTDFFVSELVEIANSGRFKIILAHIERSIKFQSKNAINTLLENGVHFQVNADYFVGLLSRHKALAMLKNGMIHLLGSDCHNLTTRPPKIGAAIDLIRAKFGDSYVDQIDEFGHLLLNNNK